MKNLCFLILILSALTSVSGQNKPDSIYLLFNPESEVMYVDSVDVMTVHGQRIQLYQFIIQMGMGIDLCFMNDYNELNDYSEQLTFSEFGTISPKEYKWIRDNYYVYDQPGEQGEFIQLCNDHLKMDSTEFFLVIPDSIHRTVNVLHVLNCNYGSY